MHPFRSRNLTNTPKHVSGFRCVGCRNYFPADAPGQRTVGLGRACSDQCARNKQTRSNRSRSEHAVASSNKPQLERSLTARPKISSDIPPATRARVTLRDNGRCRFCGVRRFELHHINLKSQGIDHQDHNLIALCGEHHRLMHSNTRYWRPVLLAYIWLIYSDHRTYIPAVETALRRRKLI